ncbi:MAG: 2-C-methyl-D-erythritol 4-phosphate cytidylyltransferase [Candidatus Moranbacteria bacterium]|nr:2-C-methyl-D-erythritol 4-phosphate cytidylyltransferase [Candidatus Moranbacteria bacterium]
MNIAIILASGSGRRMGAGKNKTLLKLGGRPIIFYVLDVFDESSQINEIILTVGAGEEKVFEEIIKKYGFKKKIRVIVGGKERQDSGYNAIRFIDSEGEKKKNKGIVLFHNGANPFVKKKEIKSSIEAAKKYGAAVVGHRTKDTIRQVDGRGISLGVVDRSGLWNMQTPQAIKFPLAKKAFQKARKDNFLGTDDVSLVERLGKKVKIIEASEYNFKITTPLDMELARIVFKKIKDDLKK